MTVRKSPNTNQLGTSLNCIINQYIIKDINNAHKQYHNFIIDITNQIYE